MEYFKKFEVNKNQISEAATKEVFCDKNVLKLLAISLQILYFFHSIIIGDFSVRNYMQKTIFLMAATEITMTFTPVHLQFKFLKQTIQVLQC